MGYTLKRLIYIPRDLAQLEHGADIAKVVGSIFV